MKWHHKIICCKNKMKNYLRILVLAKTFEYDKTIVDIDLIQFAKNKKIAYRILYLLLIHVMISTRSNTISYERWVILVCVVNQNLAVVIVVNKTLIILLRLLLISWDLTVCVVLARHRGCVCNRRTNDLKSNWYKNLSNFLSKKSSRTEEKIINCTFDKVFKYQ